MKKPEKNLLIIFLLFLIYFITIINFSLKFREGACNSACRRRKRARAAKKYCKSGPVGKYERYTLFKKGRLPSKIKCMKCKNKYRATCNSGDYNKIDKTICETSRCHRAYKRQKPGHPRIGKNVFDENKNPCMKLDFCKNCKKCNDAKTPTTGNVTLDDGKDFDCTKCKIPDPPAATVSDDKSCVIL